MTPDDPDARTAAAVASPIVLIAGPSGAGKTTVSRAVATAFDLGVHLQADGFGDMVVSGYIDPWRDEAAHQNTVVGVTVAAAAIQFALGGYTTVVDGTFLPDGALGVARFAARQRVAVHYVVLRAPLAVCEQRLMARDGHVDTEPFRALHDRYGELDGLEAHAVDADAPIAAVGDAVVSGIRSGRFVLRP